MKKHNNDSILSNSPTGVMIPHGPLRILGTITLAVFIGEALVMLLLSLLPPLSLFTEAIVDAFLLIVVISPALYLFLFLPIIRHVHRRDEAERSVRKSRDLLQTVFNGISDPLIMLDDQMKVLMINDAAGRYYQIGDQTPIDRPCRQALVADSRTCAECDIPERMASNSSTMFERPGLFDPSRTEQVVVYRTAEDADTTGAIIIRIEDVTEARALARRMLQQERLASLGLLISGMAHEINNPNNFILFNLPILSGYLHDLIPIIDEYASHHADFEIANMTYADFRADLFRLVENISYGSGRIDTLVSRLREFSRIQDAQTLRKVDMATALQQLAAMADAQIALMVERFEIDISESLPEMVTDRLAVEQMVLNLLINAGQAADKSDSWVSMKARRVLDGPYALAVEIADNGSGMDEETLKQIFDPLFTTKGPDAGMGLGLYICHNLAQGLGGTIEVTSTPGAGSTFRLLLPDLKEKLTEHELD